MEMHGEGFQGSGKRSPAILSKEAGGNPQAGGGGTDGTNTGMDDQPLPGGEATGMRRDERRREKGTPMKEMNEDN